MGSLRIILVFVFSLAGLSLLAQGEYSATQQRKLALYASLSGTATFDDFGIGTALGIINKQRDFAIFTTFEARPYRRAILDFQGGNQFLQLREERYLIGLGAEYLKMLNNNGKGIFAQLNANYTWGHFGGTIAQPGKGWVLTPRAGVFLKMGKSGVLKLGYSYQPIKTDDISAHRVYISIAGFAENDH